ncbi:hypothetical protein [Micromonospora sp. NPDC006431]|uniref:hypothetical protein n=1 Tax=Micromonospora sp. NPDC006431 TaxID=3364235 RepID=UPI0036D13182
MRTAPVAAVILAVLLAPLTGCAQTGGTTATETGGTTATRTGGPTAPQAGATPATPSATATDAGSPGRPGVDVVLTRTGGIVGLEDTLTVTPDGHWTRVNRAGAARTGQLSPAELDRLRQLTADPRLVAEATATRTTMCADAFTYRLTVGPVTTGYVDCPPEVTPPAATAAVVELLTGLLD